jgi:predicted type IV restriction endonuclease
MSRNEANTRKDLIDRALEKAGWSLKDSNQVGIEIPWMADIPDILTCWKNGFNPDFTTQRAERLSELKFEIAPMKAHKYDL